MRDTDDVCIKFNCCYYNKSESNHCIRFFDVRRACTIVKIKQLSNREKITADIKKMNKTLKEGDVNGCIPGDSVLIRPTVAGEQI